MSEAARSPGSGEPGDRVARRSHSSPRIHRAWIVAAVAFVALIGAAGFRSVPSVLLDPLHEEFGWSHATIGSAVSVNLLLYGLMAPFAAALMDRFGIRRVVSIALVLVAVGSAATVFMTEAWQLVLCWGLLVGLGVGSVAMPLRRDDHRTVVRPQPGPGDRRAHRRERDRAADLPAAGRRARHRARLAGARPRRRCRRARGGAAGAVVRARLPERRRSARLRRGSRQRRRRTGDRARGRLAGGAGARPRRAYAHLLDARRWICDLWGVDERADRYAFRQRRPRPRHEHIRRRPHCWRSSGSSTSPARSSPAGSPTASTRECCSSSTTHCAGCR